MMLLEAGLVEAKVWVRRGRSKASHDLEPMLLPGRRPNVAAALEPARLGGPREAYRALLEGVDASGRLTN